MNYSKNGFHLTEQFEGCKLVAYQDVAGIATIGYGHTRNVRMGMVCTQELAEQWLLEDVEDAEHAVNALVKVPLTQNQFDALVDLTFNIGIGNFQRSTLLRLLNRNDFAEAAEEFVKWNRSNGLIRDGLTKRRRLEKEIFLNQGESC